jgi:hypothetical protein
MNIHTGYQVATYGSVPWAQLFEVDCGSRRVVGMCVYFQEGGARMLLELTPGEEGAPCIREPLQDGTAVAVIEHATVVAPVTDKDKRVRLSFGSISPHPSYFLQCPETSYIGCLDHDGVFWADLTNGLLCRRSPNGLPSITFRWWRIVRRSTELARDEPVCEFSPKKPVA